MAGLISLLSPSTEPDFGRAAALFSSATTIPIKEIEQRNIDIIINKPKSGSPDVRPKRKTNKKESKSMDVTKRAN
jgi:hypothetical protein